MIRVLNLYAGLGGNRLLWKNVKVVAVEINRQIAECYSEMFPDDEVIVTDAREFLLDNYSKFDFIWASPPCTSHSRARFWASKGKKYKPVYPDFSLYEMIVFLQHFRKKPWVVENTVPYYKPLIKPTVKIGRHYFWSNFRISKIDIQGSDMVETSKIEEILKSKGLPVEIYMKVLKKIRGMRKDRLVRDMVRPEIGKHILDEALKSLKTVRKSKIR